MSIGDLCRSILSEAHETLPADQQGPFFVVHFHGEFDLYPFGNYARGRYWYRVRPVWVQIDELPDWTFYVMGIWH